MVETRVGLCSYGKESCFSNCGGSCDNIDDGASPGKWLCLPLGEFVDSELIIIGWSKS